MEDTGTHVLGYIGTDCREHKQMEIEVNNNNQNDNKLHNIVMIQDPTVEKAKC